MTHTIVTLADRLVAHERDARGTSTGRSFSVPLDTPGGPRAYMNSILDRIEASDVLTEMRAVMEDAGFDHRTPSAITARLIANPDELEATVDALHDIYPRIRQIVGDGRTPMFKTGLVPGMLPPWEDARPVATA